MFSCIVVTLYSSSHVPYHMDTNFSAEYLAGLFDGEGCINIYKRRRERARGGYELIPQAIVCLTKGSEILHELKSRYGGDLSIRQRQANWSPVTYWNLRHKGLKKFLNDILPYLIIKKQQAMLALEYSSIHGGGRHFLYEGEKERQIELYNKLRLLNARGNEKPVLMDTAVPGVYRKHIKYEEGELRRMYWDKKMSTVEIAKQYGVCSRAIGKAFSKFHIPMREPSDRGKLCSLHRECKPVATKEELARLYCVEGLSLREIGERFHVSHVPILRLMQKYGIPRRERVWEGRRKNI